MVDGTIEMIGPTASAIAHYRWIVAVLENGMTEVFCSHASRWLRPPASAPRRRTPRANAAGLI
jgi:hypothetical protein